MPVRLGAVSVETVAGESAKFTAPMLLIHGLWCTAAVWRPFMGYFAHRGWTCHALQLRGGRAASDAGGHGGSADYAAAVDAAIAACGTPPVLLGHDAGALLALDAGSAAAAVVAMAPLVPGHVAPIPRRPWRSLFGRRQGETGAPRGRIAERYFGPGVPGGTASEPCAVVRDFDRMTLRARPAVAVPTLLLAGACDLVSPPAAVSALAAHVAAQCRIVADAVHAMPWAAGWEQRVGEIHRWLIRALGDRLLAPRDDEEEAAPQ